ncbi:uncharacterized protein [Henckelia pumila]|uniref:uncharacterized protein n=1 Tax=Henckelia pumila TaxID=405737 RepID=UPI003C6E06B4
MARTETRLEILETHVANMGVVLQSMETSIGQLANALKDNNCGQFPSNTEVNPIEQCKAIELRSGKKVDNEECKPESKISEKYAFEENEVEENPSELELKPMYKSPLPYPQRFKKKVLDEQFSKFLEIFKKLHINIPFADALLQMPNYAKFLKEVMSRNRKLEEFETVNLTEECNVILQKKLPQKLKDPGSFTIPCIIDFVVLDMEEDGNMPLILGRPFLATAEAKIDVKKGELSMGVDSEKVIFNVFKVANNPSTKKVFMIKKSKNMESFRADVSAIEVPKEKDLLVLKKKKKKRSNFKRFVEFVWRVKEKGKT